MLTSPVNINCVDCSKFARPGRSGRANLLPDINLDINPIRRGNDDCTARIPHSAGFKGEEIGHKEDVAEFRVRSCL